MRRRLHAVLALAALLLVIGHRDASAHATFITSDPAAGSTLDVAPTTVRLVFSEEPEPDLSKVEIVDGAGTAHQAGVPRLVPLSPHTLEIAVRPLERGLYTVRFRAVSAVDGHPTVGAFVFGVGVSPAASDIAAAQTGPRALSWLEVAARWTFIIGLAALLGAAFGAAAGFARPAGSWVLGGGWATSVVGLALFAEAQRRNAGASLGDLWGTSLGRALAWRAAALAVAGVLLVVTTRGPRIVRRAGQWLAALAALSGIAVHVSAGHAAGTGSWAWVSVAVQWAHFGAAGVWIGGLAALLVATRGASSQRKADAVRRYSGVATLTFLVVVATGLVRAFGELSAWNELTSTGYGRAVLAKTALLVGIAALAAAQRWRNLPRAATDMGPLRRAGGVELVVAVGAMLAAAVLGSVPPPATATEAGIVAVGADYATSVRVRLTAASAQPGGNQFAVRVVDHDSGRPVVADAISLEFTPLDDPGAAPTTLALEAGTDGSFAGSGANLAFDGRWQIGVLIQRGATSMTVPLEVEVRGPPQFVSVEQVPGQPVFYTIEAAGSVGFVRIWADRQEAGAVQVFATIVDAQMQELAVDQVVITLARGSASAAQQAVRRLAPGQFVADVTLRSGQTTVAVVAHATNGARLRAAVDLEIE